MRTILSLTLCVLLASQSGGAQTPAAELASDSKPIKIKRGSELNLVLAEEVSSATAKKGQTVRLELYEDWVVEGQVILPKGTSALGVVNQLMHAIPGKRDGVVDIKPVSIQLPSVGKLRLSDYPPGEDACGDMGPCWAFATIAFTVFLPLTLPALIVEGARPKDHRDGKDRILPVGYKVFTYTGRTIVLPARSLADPNTTK
jgi:hypothetical protein